MVSSCHTHLCDHLVYAVKTKMEITEIPVTSMAMLQEKAGKLAAPGADAPRTVVPLGTGG